MTIKHSLVSAVGNCTYASEAHWLPYNKRYKKGVYDEGEFKLRPIKMIVLVITIEAIECNQTYIKYKANYKNNSNNSKLIIHNLITNYLFLYVFLKKIGRIFRFKQNVSRPRSKKER